MCHMAFTKKKKKQTIINIDIYSSTKLPWLCATPRRRRHLCFTRLCEPWKMISSGGTSCDEDVALLLHVGCDVGTAPCLHLLHHNSVRFLKRVSALSNKNRSDYNNWNTHSGRQ
ncbi:uncharacterized protein LOC135401508 isoform X4 [Ornithodoros turicata]|uniref:uncharacterized protein LOC135401508 isoform X4 n=1 Tax=Ornithodoros turicata TaxID=34597 RepID=UPI0031393E62